MKNEKQLKKAPFDDLPLRNPGQSGDEAMQDLFIEKILFPLILAIAVLIMSILEWQRYYHPLPSPPILNSIITLGLVIFMGFRILRSFREFNNHKLGRDGEKIVGQSLEELRTLGHSVLHDILGKGFNLDHVVFSKHGIFVIETKTISKPAKGQAEITFKGEQLLANGHRISRNPIEQVSAAANWLEKLLKASTGKKYPVKGIVVFLGWYVQQLPDYLKHKIWVLNPKALPSFISHEPERLKDDEVHMAVYHLSRHVRLASARN